MKLKHSSDNFTTKCLDRGHVVSVEGLQYGDEGKGKVITALQDDFKYVVRAQGGGNAGHTIEVNKQKVVLNHLPSGLAGKETIGVLGQGMVINIKTVQDEIKRLEGAGKQMKGENNIVLMGGAQFILPSLQGVLDGYFSGSIGSTKRGIGPAYALQALRLPLTFNDMVSYPNHCVESFIFLCNSFKENVKLDFQKIAAEFQEHKAILDALFKEKYISLDAENSVVLNAFYKNDPILLEGAQAQLLDLKQGSYPFVTSSNTTFSGLMNGSGCPDIHTRIGVIKPYTTRVGGGPFMSQLLDEQKEADFVEKVGEKGATTGRVRGIGYANGVELRRSVQSSKPDFLAVTKLDVLREMGERTKMVNAYKSQNDGRVYTNTLPPVKELEGRNKRYYKNILPEYIDITVPQEDISGITSFQDIPKSYHEYISTLLGIAEFKGESVLIGTGPGVDAFCVADIDHNS